MNTGYTQVPQDARLCAAAPEKKNGFLLDFSLGLVNRTGAFYLCRDLMQALPHHFPAVRYWRMLTHRPPEGIVRSVAARLMMLELRTLRGMETAYWPESKTPRRNRLFLDPLYVLRSRLDARDIVLCHDIGPVSHPELFEAGVSSLYCEAYEKIARVGPGMVFVSDSSQRAFRQRYGDNFRFLQTILLYARPELLQGAADACPGIEPPFLLTVAALEKRKNHLRVLAAYASSGLNRQGVSYVVCGPRGEGAQAIIDKASAIPGVKILGYVSDSQLRWLYNNARGFVLPSLVEGFGLPALEAAQHYVVPLVSRLGAQEEVMGDAGVLVDPNSTSSIKEGLIRLVDMDQETRAALLARAAARVKTLSFSRFVQGWHVVLGRNDKFQNTDGWAASDPVELARAVSDNN